MDSGTGRLPSGPGEALSTARGQRSGASLSPGTEAVAVSPLFAVSLPSRPQLLRRHRLALAGSMQTQHGNTMKRWPRHAGVRGHRAVEGCTPGSGYCTSAPLQ